MKLIGTLFLVLNLFACETVIEKTVLNHHEYTLTELLNNCDSIDCWATTWYSQYDKTSKLLVGSEAQYCGIVVPTKDSLFSFTYPSKFFSSEQYYIHGRKIIVENETEKKFRIDSDTLWIQWIGPHEYYEDTVQHINVYSFVKMRVNSDLLLELYTIGPYQDCDTCGWDASECMEKWGNLYDNLSGNFNVPYQEF